jgi:flagellar motor switch protein FliN/FliY
MATDAPNDDDKPGADLGGEGAGEWAEALIDQKEGSKLDDDQPGGVLSGDRPARPFGNGGDGPVNDINMVLDIPVQLSVELGRTRVSIKHILQLGQGSVVELDALAGEPMDVLVNGYLIAQGEVVVVNDKFGIRLTDVVTPSERLRRINKG